jgi:TIR domain
MTRRIDRIRLIDRIGRKLQAEMSYDEIRGYLGDFAVDCSKPTSGVNSKWVFAKELLSNEPLERVLDIAEDLEIEHGVVRALGVDQSAAKFWLPGYFRLFLSHLSTFKEKTSQLQQALKPYGVSGFVAHEDIDPTLEWQTEIEKALHTMDALAAILTPGFRESAWTDQETGFALGRGVLVIPIRRGLDPYGFIARFQGIQGSSRTVAQVAEEIFLALIRNGRTKGRIADVLAQLLLFARTGQDATHWLELLKRFEKVPLPALKRLHETALQTDTLLDTETLLPSLNALFVENGLTELTAPQEVGALLEDDIPF